MQAVRTTRFLVALWASACTERQVPRRPRALRGLASGSSSSPVPMPPAAERDRRAQRAAEPAEDPLRDRRACYTQRGVARAAALVESGRCARSGGGSRRDEVVHASADADAPASSALRGRLHGAAGDGNRARRARRRARTACVREGLQRGALASGRRMSERAVGCADYLEAPLGRRALAPVASRGARLPATRRARLAAARAPPAAAIRPATSQARAATRAARDAKRRAALERALRREHHAESSPERSIAIGALEPARQHQPTPTSRRAAPPAPAPESRAPRRPVWRGGRLRRRSARRGVRPSTRAWARLASNG